MVEFRTPVYRALNEPLTICDVERKLFACIAILSMALFYVSGALLVAALLFLVLWIAARAATQYDPQILRIILNSNRLAARYDPAQFDPEI